MKRMFTVLLLCLTSSIWAAEDINEQKGWIIGQHHGLQPNSRIVSEPIDSTDPEGFSPFGVYCAYSATSESEFWMTLSTSMNLGPADAVKRVSYTIDGNDPITESWTITATGKAVFKLIPEAFLTDGFNGNVVMLQFHHAGEFHRAIFNLDDIDESIEELTEVCQHKILPPAAQCVHLKKIPNRQFFTIRSECEKQVMIYFVDLIELIPSGVWEADAPDANLGLLADYGGKRYNVCSKQFMYPGAKVWHHEIFLGAARRSMVDYCVKYDYSLDELLEAGYETCQEFRQEFRNDGCY